jgi:chaperone modulatory protein CbpM
MNTNESPLRHAICIIEEQSGFTLEDLCRACAASLETGSEIIIELVEEGVLEPTGATPAEWRFDGLSVRRARVALTLWRDLGVNTAGAALALQLMEELATLRSRLGALGDS